MTNHPAAGPARPTAQRAKAAASTARRRVTATVNAITMRVTADPFVDGRPLPAPVTRQQLEEACGWQQLLDDRLVTGEQSALQLARLRPSCLFVDRFVHYQPDATPALVDLDQAAALVRRAAGCATSAGGDGRTADPPTSARKRHDAPRPGAP